MRGKQDHSSERSLRRDQTEAERLLWTRLRGRRLQDYGFRREHRIGRYIVDFGCPEYRLVIELDGSQHLDAAEYDASRTRSLQRQGYRVVRFWNHEVMLDMSRVLDEILRALRTPHLARCASLSLSPLCGARETD